MGIITTNANVITGSATNTLGTLGRSIFNSTIGTFVDKDSMNQIYGAINKLTSSIETMDKSVDFEALKGRNKADDLFSLLAGLDIKSSSDFMNKNREFMKRLMRLNKQEKDITLEALGVDVTGESDVIRNEYVREYEHVKGNNYLEDYVNTLAQNQQIGDETTTLQLESSTNFNYAGIHNDLYVVNQNLYPDDENKGTFANKWIAENRNSLLSKTKKLFNANKINTIISRFHTNPNKRPSLLDNAKSKYGLSHGRNLLTKDAETGYNSSYANGYDNPYCRVWTHHHQYDRYYKTIRPFSQVDNQGNYGSTISVQDFHKWKQFSDDKDRNGETKGKWGWKKDSNNGWQYSVLNDNGMVNVTPIYDGGGAKNIHTKQCMFSIENLAWRGYDPYSFEQALSWEQRGPLGGRIMWFPPYGIQFNETTTTQWMSHTFLGRGEDVYTYTNTMRTGTLSFMMVVDHPSILDYVSWTNENKNVTDTDILRFLAGCGEGGGNGLRDYAKPTPLTDEYTQEHNTDYANEKFEEIGKSNPEEEKPTDKGFCFYVFYPNNYSGTYDDPEGEFGKQTDIITKVEPIPYLLAGSGAQKKNGNISADFSNDSPLKDKYDKDEGTVKDTWTGVGYEMAENDKEGLGTPTNNFISGTFKFPNSKDTKTGERRYWTGLGKNNCQTSYVIGSKNHKRWYYRIDGRYVWPQDTNEEKSHYYNQDLQSYVDKQSLGLNRLIGKIDEHFDSVKKTEGESDKYTLSERDGVEVFTLAEVAYVLYEGDSDKQERCRIDNPDNERIKRLKELVKNIKEVKSIISYGGASAQGYDETNEKLWRHRAMTAVHWFKNNIKENLSTDIKFNSESIDGKTGEMGNGDVEVKDQKRVSGDESSPTAKKNRYARVEILFETSDSSTPSTANNTENPNKDDENNDNKSGFMFEGFGDPINPQFIKSTEEGGYDVTKYDANWKFSRIEMTGQGNDFSFVITDKTGNNDEVYSVTEYNIGGAGNITVTVNEENYVLDKRYSFVAIDSNNKEENYVIYQYKAEDEKNINKLINVSKNDKENYYIIEEMFVEESLKHTFVITKPVLVLGIENEIKSSDYLTELRGVEYDAPNRMLTIIDGNENAISRKCSYSKYTKDFDDKDILVVGFEDEKYGTTKIIIRKEPSIVDKSIIYCNDSVVSIENECVMELLPFKGKNYYYTQKDGAKRKEEVGKNDNILIVKADDVEVLNLSKTAFILKSGIEKTTDPDIYKLRIETWYKDNVYSITNVKSQKMGEGEYVYSFNSGNKTFRVSTVDDDVCYVIMEREGSEIEGAHIKGKEVKIYRYDNVEDANKDDSKEEQSQSAKAITYSNSDNVQTLQEDEKKDPKDNKESEDKGNENSDKKDDKKQTVKENKGKTYIGYRPTGTTGMYKSDKDKEPKTYPIYEDDKGKKWFMITDKNSKIAKFVSVGYAAEYEIEPKERWQTNGDENRLRYDQEYHFFKVLKQTDPVVYGSLMDKLQYFDPAFHSMTPEGFNGRLTFLQQCMRQGNTVSASDGKFAKSANNLAFGRAPYCVLRLGDFYNQMIVIDNLSISYDPLVWDLNIEGVGVQPLIANVQISFKFVGGGDMTGPVRRLQNAMSFNYYANARLYDNRADRIERKWSDKTNGAIEHDEILPADMEKMGDKEKKAFNVNESSSFYTTQMYK